MPGTINMNIDQKTFLSSFYVSSKSGIHLIHFILWKKKVIAVLSGYLKKKNNNISNAYLLNILFFYDKFF